MNSTNLSLWVVIPAAGVGKRMQADYPKQYMPLLNKTVIEQTLSCFDHHHEIILGIIVALHPDDPYWSNRNLNLKNACFSIDGGKERSDSVLNALQMMRSNLQVEDDAWVLVHDAARPCLLASDIDKLISTCINTKNAVGGILAKKASDTIKRSTKNSTIICTEDRENLWHALTPQMFRVGALFNALTEAKKKNIAITDEASAIENQGKSPLLIEASGSNIKITHPDDLALAEFLLRNQIDV